MSPPFLGRGRNARADSCRRHSWAKDLGASDTKKPWERHRGHTSLGRTKGRRWELRVWSLDSEPQGTSLGLENAWEGEIPKRGELPRDECLLLTGLGTRTCLPV